MNTYRMVWWQYQKVQVNTTERARQYSPDGSGILSRREVRERFSGQRDPKYLREKLFRFKKNYK